MDPKDEITDKMKNINIKSKSNINILLLGETGVGKSTFVNSLVNYLHYKDFEKAEQENLHVLIPSKFTVFDKNKEYHIIKIGSENDQNEYLDTGASATQDVKTYVFPVWNKQLFIRIIDTPGMGDTRGVEQDDINCENILGYISQLHELHAICFLFGPKNTRQTTYFKYCMNQILSRLEKSAGRNMIFIFTNARGENYSPGETFSLLKEVIKEIKENPPFVDIRLDSNIFCFDNEAFRYLAAVKKGIQFKDSFRTICQESWKLSSQACWKLITYIVGDASNAPLMPHCVKNTVSINEARRLIIQLTQPLAEIAQHINENIHSLEKHEAYLKIGNQGLEELKKKLHVPVINLKVIKLTQPVTVCTSSMCADVYKVGDINKWHYKKRCHDPCKLNNVPKEIIGSPALTECSSIDKSTKKCKICSCDFSIHMHVYYLTKTIEDKIIDASILKQISSEEEALEKAREIIKSIVLRKAELEGEHRTIITCSARFAHFLQNNAITPFNDSYLEYIKQLIIREKSLGIQSNMNTIDHLEKILKEYNEMKKTFDEALVLQKKIGVDMAVTPKQINESKEELFKLKHSGEKIKELWTSQEESKKKEYKTTEYVHKSFPDNNRKDNIQSTKKKGNFKTKPLKEGFKTQQNKGLTNVAQNRRPCPPYEQISQPYPPLSVHSQSAYNIPPFSHGHYPYQPGYDYREHSGSGVSSSAYQREDISRSAVSDSIEVKLTVPRPGNATVPPPPRDPYLARDPYLSRDPYLPRDLHLPRGPYSPVDRYPPIDPYDHRRVYQGESHPYSGPSSLEAYSPRDPRLHYPGSGIPPPPPNYYPPPPPYSEPPQSCRSHLTNNANCNKKNSSSKRGTSSHNRGRGGGTGYRGGRGGGIRKNKVGRKSSNKDSDDDEWCFV